MAHLILALEPHPQIRRQFLDRAREMLTAETALQVDSAEIGEFAIVWGGSYQAPIECSQTENDFALLLGYALADDHGNMTAEHLRREKLGHIWPREAYDGYFAAVRYSRSAGLAVDIDLLGFFPMFFSQQKQSQLIGTSGALFEAHPDFRVELDPVGLTGVLLSNGLVNNRTLLRNVTQLTAGHQLRVLPDGHLAEVETCKISAPPVNERHSYDEILSFVQEEFRNAIERHRPDRSETTLLLSGGLDSRLMGGYLKELDVDFTVTTLGKPIDFEVRAAQQVAQHLNVPLILKDTDCSPEELVKTTRHFARWEHLTHGFSGIQTVNASFGEIAPLFWSGHFLDDILGGSAFGYAQDKKTGLLSFETFFRKLNRWGIAPAELQELMRPAFSDSEDVVNGLVEDLRDQWNRFDGTNAQKSFRMKLATRGRYHLAGALHRFSQVSWPIAPYLDQRLLSSLLQIPPEAMLGRRLETDLLNTQLIDLSRLPLDTNSFRFENSATLQLSSPFDPRKLWRSARKFARTGYWRHYRKEEPRRYRRVFDPDQHAWKTIRASAEPNRQNLGEWMDCDRLARFVPLPGEGLRLDDPFAGGAALRSLCGLMLWESETQSQFRAAA